MQQSAGEADGLQACSALIRQKGHHLLWQVLVLLLCVLAGASNVVLQSNSPRHMDMTTSGPGPSFLPKYVVLVLQFDKHIKSCSLMQTTPLIVLLLMLVYLASTTIPLLPSMSFLSRTSHASLLPSPASLSRHPRFLSSPPHLLNPPTSCTSSLPMSGHFILGVTPFPSLAGGLSDMYEVKHLLGSGSAGDTWLCRDKATGEVLAVKLIKRPLPAAMGTTLMREVKIGAQLGKGHINIVKPKEVVLTK